MIIIARDVVASVVPEITAAKFVDAGDGYHALQMPDGHYVGRTGDGQWHYDATAIGAWEKCKLSGQIVTWNGAGCLTVPTWAEV